MGPPVTEEMPGPCGSHGPRGWHLGLGRRVPPWSRTLTGPPFLPGPLGWAFLPAPPPQSAGAPHSLLPPESPRLKLKLKQK